MTATWPLEDGGSSLPLLEPLESPPPSAPLHVGVDDECPPQLGVVFRHSGWQRHRDLVYAALRRTRQPIHRIAAFEQCGARAFVLQSVAEPTVYRLAGSG